MAAKLYVGTTALVLKTELPIESYEDTKTIKDGKLSHNRTMLRLNETLHGLCVGGSCFCPLAKTVPPTSSGTGLACPF